MKKQLIAAIVSTVALVSAQNSYGYTHTIVNATPNKALVKLNYVSSVFCSNDEFELPPFTSFENSAGLCILNGVSAKVYEGDSKNAINWGGVDVHVASPYKSTYTGNSMWIIAGPVQNQQKISGKNVTHDQYRGSRYVVTRVVQ